MAFVASTSLRAAGRVASAAKASAPRRARCSARDAVWAPGNQAPAHLDGTLPGDFGFDPLGLGEDPKQLAWYSQAELIHSRFAMLALFGVMGQGAASSIGLQWPGAGVEWYEQGTFDGYFASTNTLLTTQFLLMGWAETRRYMDLKTPGSANVDPIFPDNKIPDGAGVGYPGGVFDPLNYGEGNGLAELQLKEIKNGRLAMIGMVGLYAQYAATGVSPLQNLADHVADPFNNNIITSLSDSFIWDWANPKADWIAPVVGSGVGYPAL